MLRSESMRLFVLVFLRFTWRLQYEFCPTKLYRQRDKCKQLLGVLLIPSCYWYVPILLRLCAAAHKILWTHTQIQKFKAKNSLITILLLSKFVALKFSVKSGYFHNLAATPTPQFLRVDASESTVFLVYYFLLSPAMTWMGFTCQKQKSRWPLCISVKLGTVPCTYPIIPSNNVNLPTNLPIPTHAPCDTHVSVLCSHHSPCPVLCKIAAAQQTRRDCCAHFACK